MSRHLDRAQLLFDQSRHELAMAELHQHLAEDPDNPLVHSMLALCLSELKQFAEATKEAELAIHLGPSIAFTHYALAHVLLDRNQPALALPAAQEALRLDPEDADYFATLARIHFLQSRWREALDAANQGLALDSEHLACTNLRAMSLMKLGRKAEAGATIDTALARNPENALTHANQGWTLLERRQPKQAMEHFREALRLDPELEWARSGIVEAMKARHGVYRWMLMWFFWMARLPPRVQWGVVIGGYFVVQALSRLQDAHPGWSLWIAPLLFAYVLFALMTWIADPLFNLLLRLNRFGRLALTREQVVASNWLGLCVLAGVTSFAAAMLLDSGALLLAALVCCVLTIPVSAIFRCVRGRPRTLMTVYTIALASVSLIALFGGRFFPDVLLPLVPPCQKLALWGAIAAPWVSNVLIAIKTRY